MSELRRPPAEVPTLTEIVEEGPSAAPAGAVVLPLRVGVGAMPTASDPEVPLALAECAAVASTTTSSAAELDEEALFQEVLSELRVQVDRMLEYRLREAMAPVLARAMDVLVQDAKAELSATMQDVLRRTVAQVIARNRPR